MPNLFLFSVPVCLSLSLPAPPSPLRHEPCRYAEPSHAALQGAGVTVCYVWDTRKDTQKCTHVHTRTHIKEQGVSVRFGVYCL